MPEDRWGESRPPDCTAKDNRILGKPRSWERKTPRHPRWSTRGSWERCQALWASHRGMVERQPQEEPSPLYLIHTANTLTPWMWMWPLDSTMGATTAHRSPERMADGTCTRGWVWMTDKCRRRMNIRKWYITREISQKKGIAVRKRLESFNCEVSEEKKKNSSSDKAWE